MTAAWKCIVVALALRQEVREAWNLAQQILTVVPKLLHREATSFGAEAREGRFALSKVVAARMRDDVNVLAVRQVFIWINRFTTSAFPQPKCGARHIGLVHASGARLSDHLVAYATMWFAGASYAILVTIGDLVASASALGSPHIKLVSQCGMVTQVSSAQLPST